MPITKKKYTTEFKRCYKAGLLNKFEIKSIPRSTRLYWRKQNLNSHISPSAFEDKANTCLQSKYEKLLILTKALFQVLYCYKSITLNPTSPKNAICKYVELVKNKVGLKRCLHWLNTSTQQYYAWLHQYDCKASLLKLCRKRYNHQLTEKEVLVVKEYLNNDELKFWNLPSIYCKMLVDKAAFMCIGTFRKYAKLLNYCKPKVLSDKLYFALKAIKPFAILHMDVTIFRPIDRSKVYLYVLMDNFSRCILGYTCSMQFSPSNTKLVLETAYAKHNLKLVDEVTIVSDDGVENKSLVDEFVSSFYNLNHVIAQKDIVQSNSMVEAVNKRLKYDFLFTKPLADFAAVESFLVDAIASYNAKPLFSLSGYSPNEVLQGAIPSNTRFANEIANATTIRKNANTSFRCCLPAMQ